MTSAAAAELPPLPDREGFAGSFAGASGGALIVAGGANFPDKKPWEGGKKVWYDSIFVLEKPDGKWITGGKLPRPLGYGVSVTAGGRAFFAGGSDGDRHYADFLMLTWADGKLTQTALPPLPKPLANACGVVGSRGELYVIGGIATPDATEALTSVYVIGVNLPSQRWHELPPLPVGRMLATAANADGGIFVAGGVALSAGPDGKPVRRYLKDAWQLTALHGWKRIADLPRPAVAAPSPAPDDSTGFYILGGDDGSQVNADPQKHRGFSKTVLRYETRSDTWSARGELPLASVTTPCVHWADMWIIPGGEVRPGVRTPRVWKWNPKDDPR